jgi:site-specific DNA-methyltransferase (adenine-specific)
MKQIVINGDNIELLKKYPDNYFDAVVTDPPYGLGKEPNAEELMKDWIEKGYHEISGNGFMGKEWDAFIPQPIFWKEVYRVLKHGGHILSFFGTRTYDWGVMSMRFAGFEVRDCIQWLYGSGFPKRHNISKALNKIDGVEFEEKPAEGVGFMKPDSEDWNVTKNQLIQKGESSENAKKWDGWGTALKPANEPIVLARKPLEKGLSIAENILKWGVGGINIDASRIGLTDKDNKDNGRVINRNIRESEDGWGMQDNKADRVEVLSNQGRFPANIILTHHEDCECKGTKKVKSDGHHSYKRNGGDFINGIPNQEDEGNKYAENGQEEVEDWDCHEDCPIRILDEQSGLLKSGAMDSIAKGGKYNVYSKMTERRVVNPASQGGASRFFYIAKASKSERNKGLEGFEAKQMAWSNQAKAELKRGNTEFADETKMHNKVQERINFHPTVKPIKLMQYLVKMITPPNGILLDPFCGSGTTGVACKIEGFQFVGLEQDLEYSKIAEARINNYVEDSKIDIKENNIKQTKLF